MLNELLCIILAKLAYKIISINSAKILYFKFLTIQYLYLQFINKGAIEIS
jgi:hypothetical protein